MWFLTLVTLFNATANQLDVINHLRLPIGGLPLGIIEVLAVLMLVYALVFGGGISARYPNRRVHPLFVFTLTTLLISLLLGSIGSFLGQVPLDLYMRFVRELGLWPIYLIVGYRLLGTPRSATYFSYLLIVSGALTATVLLTHFGAQTEDIEDTGVYNSVRTVWYVTAYAGLAAMLLAYSLTAGEKLLPKMIAAPLACYCIAGQGAPLHRVDWLGMFACTAGLFTLIPSGKKLSTLIKGGIVVGFLFAGLYGFIMLVSSATHRDFGEFVNDRVASMLPTARKSEKDVKAWDTRLDSMWAELDIWFHAPVIGRGIAIQDALVDKGAIPNYQAFHHNGWASILAQMGVIGLVAYMSIIAGMMFHGRRVALYAPTKGMRMIGVLAFMSSLYCFAQVLGSGMWAARYAMLHATLCGMLYRCLDMSPAVIEEQQQVEAEAYEAVPDEFVHSLPSTI